MIMATAVSAVKTAVKAAVTPQSAEEMLAALSHRAATLRGVSALEASHNELQAASERGELIALKEFHLHTEDGSRSFVRGQPMPKLDAQHKLLDPNGRSVTTRARWVARETYMALAAHLEGDVQVKLKARLRAATVKQQAAEGEIARLQQQLATAKAQLAEAVAERRTLTNEVREFVAAAPK